MPQLITKYNTAPRVFGLEADALLDPKSAFRYFVDFVKDVEDDEYITSTGTGASAATFSYDSLSGGAMRITTASGTGSTGSWGAFYSKNDFIVLDNGRRVFFDTEFTFNSLNQTSFCVGLTTGSPSTSMFDASGLVTGGGSGDRSILIGRDSGTVSLPGANSSNVKNLQLWIKDTSGAATEIVLPVSETIVAASLPYTFSLAIQGWTVQAYFNGKPIGSPVKIATQFTDAMGVVCSGANEAEVSKNYLCDYIEVTGTR